MPDSSSTIRHNHQSAHEPCNQRLAQRIRRCGLNRNKEVTARRKILSKIQHPRDQRSEPASNTGTHNFSTLVFCTTGSAHVVGEYNEQTTAPIVQHWWCLGVAQDIATSVPPQQQWSCPQTQQRHVGSPFAFTCTSGGAAHSFWPFSWTSFLLPLQSQKTQKQQHTTADSCGLDLRLEATLYSLR